LIASKRQPSSGEFGEVCEKTAGRFGVSYWREKSGMSTVGTMGKEGWVVGDGLGCLGLSLGGLVDLIPLHWHPHVVHD